MESSALNFAELMPRAAAELTQTISLAFDHVIEAGAIVQLRP